MSIKCISIFWSSDPFMNCPKGYTHMIHDHIYDIMGTDPTVLQIQLGSKETPKSFV